MKTTWSCCETLSARSGVSCCRPANDGVLGQGLHELLGEHVANPIIATKRGTVADYKRFHCSPFEQDMSDFYQARRSAADHGFLR